MSYSKQRVLTQYNNPPHVFASAPVHLLCGGLQSLGGGGDGERRRAPPAAHSKDCASHQAHIRDGEVSFNQSVNQPVTVSQGM